MPSKIIDYELGIPDYKISISDQLEMINSCLHYGIQNTSFDKIMNKIGVQTKNVCMYTQDYYNKKSYKEKMKIYEEESFYLATKTVDKLMKRIDKNKITHVLAVSCTGTYSPFLQERIANYFHLNKTCKRIQLQYMGCHAGVKALDLANSLANEKEDNTVLVICLELCSLHAVLPNSTDSHDIKMNIINNLLFGDGCSAFVVSSEVESKGYEILHTMTYVLPNSENHLTWKMGDNGFLMKIDKSIIENISNNIVNALNTFKESCPFSDDDVQLIVHPGGPAILNTIINTLHLETSALNPSFDTLTNYGNMSSCTIFFVLNQYIMNNKENLKKYGLFIAFGPGMTIEMTLIKLLNSSNYLIHECILEKNALVSNTMKRSYRRELMDRPLNYTKSYTKKDVYDTYAVFDKLYTYLFKSSTYLTKISSYTPTNLLEIGSGSGWMANKIAETFPTLQVESVDRNELSLSFCKKYEKPNVSFHSEPKNTKYDIITCSNRIHHLTNEEFIDFMKHHYAMANKGLILVDLENVNVTLQKMGWKLLSFLITNNVAIQDGYTSLEKLFTRKEIMELLLQSGIPKNNITIETLFPFRMMITIDKDTHFKNMELDATNKVEYNKKMFNLLSTTYDRATFSLSFFKDIVWKTIMLDTMRVKPEDHIIDLACGTGDLSIMLYKKFNATVVGYDISEEMINIAKIKTKTTGIDNITFKLEDCDKLNLGPNSVDHCTAGYCFRNVPDWKNTLKLVHGATKSGGTINVIDFFYPSNVLFRMVWLPLLWFWTSLNGLWYYGNAKYYNYIYYSILDFVSVEEFSQELNHIGYDDIKIVKLMLGGLYIVQATKK
jgi:ubiquinone/menaquinone biosynthesis methyltransferase